MTSNETCLTVAIDNLIISAGIAFNISQKHRFKKVMDLERNVSTCYQPTNRKLMRSSTEQISSREKTHWTHLYIDLPIFDRLRPNQDWFNFEHAKQKRFIEENSDWIDSHKAINQDLRHIQQGVDRFSTFHFRKRLASIIFKHTLLFI